MDRIGTSRSCLSFQDFSSWMRFQLNRREGIIKFLNAAWAISESGAGRRHAVRAGSATQKLEGKDAADRCREVRVLQPQTLILLDRVLFHKLINRTVKIVWRSEERRVGKDCRSRRGT